jgi:hypothetical protein
MTENNVLQYLDRLDSQREALFEALEGVGGESIWKRPAPKEWCIGEILSHTVRFYHSFLPGLKVWYLLFAWSGRLRRGRRYPVDIDNVYQRPHFPMWTGFLWPPRHTPKKPVPLAVLRAEVEAAHSEVRAFYAGKDPDVLGNIYAYDPTIGALNLITSLKVGIDHDELHYADVRKMAESVRAREWPPRS